MVSRRKPTEELSQEEIGRRAIEALFADIRQGYDFLARLSFRVTAKVKRELARRRVLPDNVRLVAQVWYPELHLEYVVYVENWSGRYRMFVLS